jgi:hypothetical protein
MSFYLWLEVIGLGKKKDIQQVDAVARSFNMTRSDRLAFGEFLESLKEGGFGGTQNDRGDFTYNELCQKAQEFLGLDEFGEDESL